MRITKSIAKDVAEKLLVNKLEHWDKLKEELYMKATEMALSKMNPEIMAFYNKYSNYCKKVKSVMFITNVNDVRKESENFSLNESIPNHGDSWYRRIEVSNEEFQFFEDLETRMELAKKEYINSLTIVEQTIFNLRTAIQLQKHFPEAYALVPKETNGTMLPMVNLDQVRALVSNN